VSTPFPPVDIDRFHAGDERLFAELVRFYSPRLLPPLRRYARAEGDVADLLQDVWLRAFQKRRGFDGRGSLFGWLLTICRTVGLASVARRGDTVDIENIDQIASSDDLEPAIHRKLEHGRLRAAIESLPARQREVVLLRVTEDRSTAESARILGCAEGTVKASLHAAIHKLQQMLEEKVP
jgi:RNA polymerase sigma factor (sigma-70 family)